MIVQCTPLLSRPVTRGFGEPRACDGQDEFVLPQIWLLGDARDESHHQPGITSNWRRHEDSKVVFCRRAQLLLAQYAVYVCRIKDEETATQLHSVDFSTGVRSSSL